METPATANAPTYAALSTVSHSLAQDLSNKNSFRDFPEDQAKTIRSKNLSPLRSNREAAIPKSDHQPRRANRPRAYRTELTTATQYIPLSVKIAVALALGLGTMIGWKRIVVTVGEKIGKEHLTYAQGASAELVAMMTIWPR